MTRTESLLTVAVAVVATLALILSAAFGVAAASVHVPCTEGDACWSWPTMGNHKRGVVTVHGTPLVVGPCRFARLYRAHVIRYAITVDGVRYPLMRRMLGDPHDPRTVCHA